MVVPRQEIVAGCWSKPSLKCFAPQLQGDIASLVQYRVEAAIPIVETYLNICNVSIYLGQLDQALKYSKDAIQLS